MSHLRIGLEMFGTQTASRHRGIGRYVRNLATALLARAPKLGHELILYAEDGPPTDLPPTVPLKLVRPEPTLRDTVARLALANPDRLDLLVLLNPLELSPGFDIPARPARGPRLAAIVYDLIPLIFQKDYLRRWPGSEFARRYFWTLERLRTYDALLAISEATRLDTIRLLNVDAGRVFAIGAAGSDQAFAFTPCPDDPADLAKVRELGITRPFVFALSAPDPRKNLNGMLESYARLPAALRETHQLALTASLDRSEIEAVRARAMKLGLGDHDLVLTGRTDDATLRALYRCATVFVFPSLYEGFGLPIVEAMACGAAVIAGDNSSQPEAAGDAALLVRVDDPDALASSLARVLTNPALARALRNKGPAQARRFSWDSVALKTLDALETCGRGAGAGHDRRRSRPVSIPGPRVASFMPSDRPEPLLNSLPLLYRVDLFHEPGHHPFARFQSRDQGCFDARLFERIDRLRPFDAVIVPSQAEADRLARESSTMRGRMVVGSEGVEAIRALIARRHPRTGGRR
jgi:glycosyltransferase involved in cell wall biosynthesis